MISRALSYCKHKLLDNDDADAINTNNHDLPLSLETALSEALSATETASNIADHSTQIHRKRTLSPNRRRHRIHFAGEKTAVIKEKTVESAEEEGQHRKDIITWIVENDQSSSSRVPNPNGVWERVVDGFAQYKAWLKQEEKQNLINSIQTNDENLEKLQVAKRKNLEGSRQWLDSVHELSATKPFVEGLLVSNKRYSEALSSATNRLRDFINDCDSKAKNHTRIRNQISNELGSLRKIRKLLAIPDPKPDVAVIGTCGIQANNTGGQDTCALNATQNTVVPDVIRVSYKVKQPKFSNLDYANYEPPFFPAMELSEVTGRAMNAL